jgi:hypothetical protein
MDCHPLEHEFFFWFCTPDKIPTNSSKNSKDRMHVHTAVPKHKTPPPPTPFTHEATLTHQQRVTRLYRAGIRLIRRWTNPRFRGSRGGAYRNRQFFPVFKNIWASTRTHPIMLRKWRMVFRLNSKETVPFQNIFEHFCTAGS